MLAFVGQDGGLLGGRETILEVEGQDDRAPNDSRTHVGARREDDEGSAYRRRGGAPQRPRKAQLLRPEPGCMDEDADHPGAAGPRRPGRSAREGDRWGKAAGAADNDRRDRPPFRSRNQAGQGHDQWDRPKAVGGARPEDLADRGAQKSRAGYGGAAGKVGAGEGMQSVNDHRRAPR